MAPDGTYGMLEGTTLNSGTVNTSISFSNGTGSIGIKLNKAGEQDINFDIEGLVIPSTDTLTITLTPRAAATMTLTTDIQAPLSNGQDFNRQPIITLKDQFGNLCTQDNSTVITASKNDIGSWNLLGTTNKPPSNGIVTFNDLGVENAAQVNNAQIIFTATGLASITSSQVALPAPGVPSVPTIAVSSEDGAVTITWDSVDRAVAYDIYMGTQVSSYEFVTTVSGTSYTKTGLSNGTTYYFVVKAVNSGGESGFSNEVSATPRRSSSVRNKNHNITVQNPLNSDVEVLVNGKPETVATLTTTKEGDKTVTTITLDSDKINEQLQHQENHATIELSVANHSDVAIAELDGQIIKNMEEKEAILQINTGHIIYRLPVVQLNMDDIWRQIGNNIELKDIKINITVRTASEDTARIVEDTANKNNYQIIVQPVQFQITCSREDKTVEVTKFNSYIERMIAIPDGIDPTKITTGIVVNKDGTFSHVPTFVVSIDGKYYAKLNSLTNSTYSVIYNPIVFEDIENHWAKEAVNDMGSRLIISGISVNKFEPETDISRAEFVTILVRALGLMRTETGKDIFSDITQDAWYYDAVSIAYEHGLVSGYGDGVFRPNDKISRDQAMVLLARAMTITKLKVEFTKGEIEELISVYEDSEKVSDWTKQAVAECIKSGIVSGYNNQLMPDNHITRAETAVIIKRMLQKSGLIN